MRRTARTACLTATLIAGCGRGLYDETLDARVDDDDAPGADAGRGDAGLTCSPAAEFGAIEALGVPAATVTSPSLSHDGLRLSYFHITRVIEGTVERTVTTVHQLTRPSRDSAFGADAVLRDGPLVELGEGLRAHFTRIDELERFVALDQGSDEVDLFVQTRPSAGGEWGTLAPVMAAGVTINTDGFQEWDPHLTADGLTLWFQREETGTMATSQIHTLTRSSLTSPFGAEATIDDSVVGDIPGSPSLTLDGRALYFSFDGDLHVSELDGTTWRPRRAISEIDTMSSESDYEPSVRPDGCEIFWVRQIDGSNQQVFHATR